MRKSVVELAAAAILMIGAALAWGQQPGPTPPKTEKVPDQPAKSKLEEMIEKALRDNPEVRLAAAKAAEAEAELSRARLLAVQKVATAYQAVEAHKAAVESAEEEFKDAKTAYEAGNPATLQPAKQKLIDAKAKLAQLEAEVPYLLGQQSAAMDSSVASWLDAVVTPSRTQASYAEFVRRYYLDVYGRLPTADEIARGEPSPPSVQGPAADRIRAALDKPFTFNAINVSLQDVIDDLNKAFQEADPGLLIKQNTGAGDLVVTVRFKNMPFGAALEWIEDTMPGCQVVVRDYGLVLMPKGEKPPPGAPLLHDFWKGTDAEQPAATSGPPAVRFVAKVMAFNNAGNLGVTLYLRPYTGVTPAPGDILEVYRIKKENRQQDQYVGSIRVAGVGPDGVTAKPLDKADVQPGDFAGVKIDAKDTSPPQTGPQPQQPGPAASRQAVEGVVKGVVKDGLLLIDLIGNSDGLAKGDRLMVIRQESELGRALLVGDVRVLEVKDGQVVVEPVEPFKTPAQPGDKVRGIEK